MRLSYIWVTLILTSAVSGYGLWSERLFEQETWSPLGLIRLAQVGTAYLCVAAAVYFWKPSYAPHLFLLLAALYSFVALGPLAPLWVLFFLGSSFLLGRLFLPGEDALDHLLALLLGVAVWILLIGTAAHFPVNTPLTYLAAFSIPFAVGRRFIRPGLDRVLGWFRPRPVSLSSYTALMLLLFVVLIQFLAVLKPEIGHDGLAMHMAIASRMTAHAVWPFDVQQFAWAVMPMGGDWAFSGVYMVGGEYAARLLNFSFFLMIAGLVFLASRRWLPLAGALLLTALFATTPLVHLVTGSLFVENVWAVFVTAAVLSLWKYHATHRTPYFLFAGVFLGCSMQVKYGSCALLPAALTLMLVEWKRSGRAGRRSMPALVAMSVLLIAFAVPPYLTAFVKTGNPVFPFMNNVFQSPYFDATIALWDNRWPTGLDWSTPYDITFRSDRYLESQAGSFGFQYLLFLPLGIPLLLRRRSYLAAAALGIGLSYALLTCLSVTYLRYLYPVLPLFMIVIAWVAAELRTQEIRLYRLLQVLAVVTVFLNGYFIPTSSWRQSDLYLNLFDQGEVSRYIAQAAPQRPLVEHLNKQFPGAKVAFLDDGPLIAPLEAEVRVVSWHYPEFSERVRAARSAQDLYDLMKELSIEYFVAPTADHPWHFKFTAVPPFLRGYTSPEVVSGNYYLARLDRKPVLLTSTKGSGVYDNTDSSIEYSGAWTLDNQFEEATGGTSFYSNNPGDSFRFRFRGSEISWVHARAFNRGMAVVSIDGEEKETVDLYSPEAHWQSRTTLSGLGDWRHVLEVRVLDGKHPDATDRYVGIDQVIVYVPGSDTYDNMDSSSTYDNMDSSIRYAGAWIFDKFKEATNGTIAYSNNPGDSFSFQFQGSEIRWVYTRAFNRGMAVVSIDGKEKETVDLYSPGIHWQSWTTLSGLDDGRHVLEVRILEDKHPYATDRYVDVDQILIK